MDAANYIIDERRPSSRLSTFMCLGTHCMKPLTLKKIGFSFKDEVFIFNNFVHET